MWGGRRSPQDDHEGTVCLTVYKTPLIKSSAGAGAGAGAGKGASAGSGTAPTFGGSGSGAAAAAGVDSSVMASSMASGVASSSMGASTASSVASRPRPPTVIGGLGLSGRREAAMPVNIPGTVTARDEWLGEAEQLSSGSSSRAAPSSPAPEAARSPRRRLFLGASDYTNSPAPRAVDYRVTSEDLLAPQPVAPAALPLADAGTPTAAAYTVADVDADLQTLTLRTLAQAPRAAEPTATLTTATGAIEGQATLGAAASASTGPGGPPAPAQQPPEGVHVLPQTMADATAPVDDLPSVVAATQPLGNLNRNRSQRGQRPGTATNTRLPSWRPEGLTAAAWAAGANATGCMVTATPLPRGGGVHVCMVP